jgi:hypothetical protein
MKYGTDVFSKAAELTCIKWVVVDNPVSRIRLLQFYQSSTLGSSYTSTKSGRD